MAIREKYDFDSLTNEAEQIVVAEIERQIPQFPELCTCSECVLDVAAYALNRVKPRYRVSLLDSVFVEPEERSDYLEEIRRAVREGMIKVGKNPPHD
jgi:competence protein ComFB